MRRFLATACLWNLMFIAGVSAQTVKPHAEHHPAEGPKQPPSASADAGHDCPMMKGEGGPMMGPDGAPSPMGQAHRMPDGMEHCSAMHSSAAAREQPHSMHPSGQQSPHKKAGEGQ